MSDSEVTASSPGWGARGTGAGHATGDRIGRYVVRRQIGSGGFGIVYEAEQVEPVRRAVALKVIKPGMDSSAVIARFEAERQALALMDHPSVARVYDGGVTELGRPYFAMELVRGEPFTEHCDLHRLALRDRIELFIRVCETVQHAHSKGVIHRDLKPSNILVEYEDGKSTPKVIDFGVAKALGQRLTEATILTAHGMMIGTPEYMSPEQAEMGVQDIDTRSDIYSLGVILYEVLTGARPLDGELLRKAGLAEIQRMIREVDPPRPSARVESAATGDGASASRMAEARRTEVRSLTGVLRRDLDWVVMRCLEKDRERRYETASALAADLRRFLADEPVLAGPPSVRYRVAKFARRNRVTVLAGVTVAGALVAATGVSIGFAIMAAEQRQRAMSLLGERDAALRAESDRAEELEAVSSLQAAQIRAISPAAMGADIGELLLDAVEEPDRAALAELLRGVNLTTIAMGTLQQILIDPLISSIDEQFPEQPKLRADLLQTVATTARELGLLDAAVDPQERAVALRVGVYGEDSLEALSSLNEHARLLLARSELDRAEQVNHRVLAVSRRVLGDRHPDTLTYLNNRGHILYMQSKPHEAEGVWRETLALRLEVLGEVHDQTLTTINNLGVVLQEQGRLDEAQEFIEQSLQLSRRLHGARHTSTIDAMSNMGRLLYMQGRHEEAEPFWREAMDLRRELLGDDHPSTLSAVNNVGVLLVALGRLEEAREYYRQSLEGRKRVLGLEHSRTIASAINLGNLDVRLEHYEDAERSLRDAYELSERVMGRNHESTIAALLSLSTVFLQTNRLEEAAALAEDLSKRSTEGLGVGHPTTISCLLQVGEVHGAAGAWDAAERAYQRALDTARTHLDADHPSTLLATYRVANSILMQGNPARAEPVALECERRCQAALGAGHEQTRDTVTLLAQIYEAWHAAEPDAHHDRKARDWRAKLAEVDGAGG